MIACILCWKHVSGTKMTHFAELSHILLLNNPAIIASLTAKLPSDTITYPSFLRCSSDNIYCRYAPLILNVRPKSKTIYLADDLLFLNICLLHTLC